MPWARARATAGADEPLVLLAQDAVLSGVRVQPGHRDPDGPAEQPPSDVVGQLDGPQHAGLGDRVDGVAQRAVRAHVDDPQRARHEQDPQVTCCAQIGKHLGLARPRVPGEPQRLLGDGGGDQCVTVPGRHQPGRLADRGYRRPCSGRRGPPEGHLFRPGSRRVRWVNAGQRQPERRRGALEAGRGADGREIGQAAGPRVGQGTQDQFGADAARISRCDQHAWPAH
jgi:hypothetical protein